MAKTATVFIEGEISYYSYMASIQGVREQLTWQGQFDEIQVTINSCGGDIAEGLGIYDLLRSYAVPITTIVIGQCCSAATIVFLAGKSRLIYENVVAFMVHQASGGGEGTADELRTIADFIDSYNERMSAIYIDATGATAEVVAEWMSQDTFMTAEEAVANGFATAIAKPVQAKAYARRPATPPAPATPPTPAPVTAAVVEPASTSNPQSNSMKIQKSRWERLSASVKAFLDGKTVVAKKVTTDDGVELTIETADGGDNYAEGDAVMKGTEVAPDGTYTVGNVTIMVKDGKIDLLKADESSDTTAENETTVTAEGSDELTRLRDENTQLKTQIGNQNTEIKALKKGMSAVSAKMDLMLKGKESSDVKIPAGNGSNKSVTAKNKAQSDEEADRDAMLNARKNRGLGITGDDE